MRLAESMSLICKVQHTHNDNHEEITRTPQIIALHSEREGNWLCNKKKPKSKTFELISAAMESGGSSNTPLCLQLCHVVESKYKDTLAQKS